MTDAKLKALQNPITPRMDRRFKALTAERDALREALEEITDGGPSRPTMLFQVIAIARAALAKTEQEKQ